ncbi:MAG: DUF2914 domain-containing protein [Acidobacteria bacterium]|nr:DUF2914 domain-containing protein [Acidobacteriota bacterium]
MFYRKAIGFLRRHEAALWWLHSAYALLFGVFVMWLGSRNFAYLRVIILHICFIWLSSLLLPTLAQHPRLGARWRERCRLLINYFNRNFYQQLLFFVLPVYYASATPGSRNMLFVILLAGVAVVSTLDIVYDRYLSVKWPLMALFFVFILFACINVMLPLLWSVSNSRAVWYSAVLALLCFATLVIRMSPWSGKRLGAFMTTATAVLFTLVYFLRPFIPPAPLSLGRAEFGRSVQSLQVLSPLLSLPAPEEGTIAALTAIRAPLGLQERVRHRWYLDGRQIYSSPYYTVTGGRSEGYRVWTRITWREELRGSMLVLDVETAGGQLIGRARLIDTGAEKKRRAAREPQRR